MNGTGQIWLLLLLALGLADVGLAVFLVGDAQRREALAHSYARPDNVSLIDEFRHRVEGVLLGTKVGDFLQIRLIRAGSNLGVGDLVAVLLAVGLSSFVLGTVLVQALGGLVLSGIGIRVFFFWLHRQALQRREQFVSQLPELSRLLSNASNAGLSMRTSVALAAQELSEPARSEMQFVADSLAVGVPIESALAQLDHRLPSRELSVLVRTLIIQVRSGGAVVSALRRMAETLDDRKDLRREITTLLSGPLYVVYLMPVFVALGIFVFSAVSPGLVNAMLTQTVGQVAIGISAFLSVSGGFIMARSVRQAAV